MQVNGNRVRELREERLLTQAELAKLAEMTESTLNRIERGKQNPRIPTIRKIAQALGIEAKEFVDG